jgi:hypothetical protein
MSVKTVVSVWGGADGFDHLALFACTEEDAIAIVLEELGKGNRVTLYRAEVPKRGFVFDRRETVH